MSLEGVRVIDLTSNVAGPFASLILGDLGADVIKIERPGSGDETRRWGPPFWGDESAAFLGLNRNKRSMALDLKNKHAQPVLERLLATGDILLSNLRPAALQRLGLSYDQLSRTYPKLICCELSGFGPVGPLAGRPAYDALVQGFSGLMSLGSSAAGEPTRIPVSILDQGTGMWAALAILNALLERSSTGAGTLIETSLLQTALLWMPTQILGYLAGGGEPRGHGSGIGSIVPYQAFEASDGHVMVAAASDALFQGLCTAIDRASLTADPRFLTNPQRVEHREELIRELAGAFRAQSVEYWCERLGQSGIPCAPIQSVRQIVEHPQVLALGALPEVPNSRIDGLRAIALPILTNGAVPAIRRAPPTLGENSARVLAELGYSDDEVSELVAKRVVELNPVRVAAS
jgi:crotonobetainyl-CoA:carnitine CoA-transferase CaiB-like acyl-CoA transferase